jgi:ribosomal protein L7/L12
MPVSKKRKYSRDPKPADYVFSREKSKLSWSLTFGELNWWLLVAPLLLFWATFLFCLYEVHRVKELSQENARLLLQLHELQNPEGSGAKLKESRPHQRADQSSFDVEKNVVRSLPNSNQRTKFSVVLAESGGDKFSVVRELMELNPKLDQASAEAYVEAAGSVVGDDFSREEAESILKKLESVGAKVTIHPSSAP